MGRVHQTLELDIPTAKRGSRWVAVCLVLAVLVCGCGQTSEPDSSDRRSLPKNWETLTDESLLADHEAVAYFARPRNSSFYSDEAYLTFINSNGKTKVVKVPPLASGQIRSTPTELRFDSQKATYRLAGKASSSVPRGGKQTQAHWATTTASGRDVTIFNSGGARNGDYITDVFSIDFSTNGGEVTHSVVPDVPGASGASDDKAWVLSAGSSNNDGEVSVYQVDLDRDDSATKLLDFKPFDNPRRFSYSTSSDVHLSEGKLWFLEELTPQKKNGRYLYKQRTNRLASIDLTTKTYSATELNDQSPSFSASPQGLVPLSIGGRAGSVYQGALYSIDTDGNLVSVSLADATVTKVGALEKIARAALRVQADWHGDKVTLLLVGPGFAKIQTYSLADGSLVSAIDSPELFTWITKHGDVTDWSMAALNK